jgi:hypothetical protein
MLTMQSDHLLPLVLDMVPQPGSKDNQPRQGSDPSVEAIRWAIVCRRCDAMSCS